MDKIKDSVWYIIIFLALAAVIFISFSIGRRIAERNITSGTLIVHDTTTKIRYITQIKTDTVIKWYERVVWKNVLPNIIYQQKIDSIFIDKIIYKDLMLRVEKKGNKLSIYAVNLNDSLIKEYNFASIGQDFIATSTTGNVYVKTKKFYWSGLELYGNYSLPINKLADWKNGIYNIGTKTGISYFDKLSLKSFVQYNSFFKEFQAGLETSYIFR